MIKKIEKLILNMSSKQADIFLFVGLQFCALSFVLAIFLLSKIGN